MNSQYKTASLVEENQSDKSGRKDTLRATIIQELINSGWIFDGVKYMPPNPSNDKEVLRNLHRIQRIERSEQQINILEKHGLGIISEFAEGREIDPTRFSPELVEVKSDSWEGNVFRFATLLWSIPVSQGYGRRMRYLVRDKSNGKWVGLFALGDPVFNLQVRDRDIGWDANDRRARLYNVMDAYVLGAVPPYNQLLGGKFVALALASNEIRDDFSDKYKGQTTIIQKRVKAACLAMITTTSALGRSSIYNRLNFPGEKEPVYRSVGYSRGWGHFHFSDKTFKMLREWLRNIGEDYADGHQYGDGPNWRFRTIRRALDLLGFDSDLLRHGIEREVFLVPLASNYREFLRGEEKSPIYHDRSLKSITGFFRERWMVPRSSRIESWKEWTRKDTWEIIIRNCSRPFTLPYS